MSSIEDARELASTIRIGSLSLELEEMRSNVVGAQLGQGGNQDESDSGGNRYGDRHGVHDRRVSASGCGCSTVTADLHRSDARYAQCI